MINRVGERIYELAGRRFNINSPKQLGEVLFTHMGLPAPVVRGKGKAISTAQDVLEQLAEKHEVPKLVLEYRQLTKLKSNLRRRIAAAGRRRFTRAYYLSIGGDRDGTAFIDQSKFAEHSYSHGAGPRDSRCVCGCAGYANAFCGLFTN